MQAQDWATFERLHRQAQFLLQARRYREAIEHALKAIALFPEDPRPYSQVAYALAWQKNPESSDWALKAIARQPENVKWRVALSDTYTLRGKWKQALMPMSEAVTMDPLNPRFQSMLGLILVHCKRPAEGAMYLKRSLELDPTNAFTHQRMSLALSKQLGKNKLAEEHLRKALELRPDDPAIKNTLGWRLLGRGHREEAEAAFYEALRVDPTQAGSKLGLGAPAGIKKGPSDIILRGAVRLYGIPYRIILAPVSGVLAIELPWQILTLGGSWLVKAVSLPLVAWGWCYIFSLVYVRVIGKRRGIQFV